MANIYWYIDGSGTSHSIYVAGTSTNSFVLEGSEFGAEHPASERVLDPSPYRLAQRYRNTIYTSGREYGYACLLKASSFSNLVTRVETWEDWHNPELGEGYIQRTAYNGNVRCLDCIPMDPEWQPNEGTNVVVGQKYYAANPWWRTATTTTASLTTSNSATDYVTTSNAGDIPAFVDITITGIVKYPKITDVNTGQYIEVRKSTSGATDEIRILGTPEYLTAKYHAAGTASGTHVPLTAGSQYITVPTGSHSMSLTATSTSGTITAVASYYQYYRSL